MKKLKYLLLLIPFLLITNVNASVITPSTVYATFDDDTVISSSYYVSSDGNYFASNTLLGGVSYQQWVKAINFYYSNTNLCPNQQLTISGKLRFTNSFFQNESYSLFINNNNSTMSCSTNLTTTYSINDTLNFSCVGTGGGNFSVYFQQNSYNTPRQYDILISRDLQYSCDVTNTDIITSQNQNTQSIINSQNSNTNSIINNQDSNTQDIINNQDTNTQNIINNQSQNTQQEIESQRVCNLYDKTSGTDGYLNNDGGIDTSTTYVVTNFLPIDKNTKIEVTQSYNNGRLCFYDMNKTLVSCLTNDTLQVGDTLTIPNNSYYVRFTIYKALNKPQFKICKNGNQSLSDNINDLNDTISSDAAPDTQNELNELDNSLISDTPITDLITLPITLLNSYISGFSGTCSPYNFGSLFGSNIIFPCINLESILGSNMWTIIDSLFSIFMIYNIAMLFIQAFEGFTSLRDDYEGLYQPKHADTGYQPKHGGGS